MKLEKDGGPGAATAARSAKAAAKGTAKKGQKALRERVAHILG